MKKYYYDPSLFEDCDPYRIPYGEPGYDPFFDRPLVKLRMHLACDPTYLALREAILDARLKRYHDSQTFEFVRAESRRLRDLLGTEPPKWLAGLARQA